MLANLMTGRSVLDVLESGEASLPDLVSSPHSWSIATLLLLLAFKGAGYGLSLGSFRGGPTFPAVFLGAVIGCSSNRCQVWEPREGSPSG